MQIYGTDFFNGISVWLGPLYFMLAIDFIVSVLHFGVYLLWLNGGYNMPELYVCLILFQIMHIWTAASLAPILFNSINIYYMNMSCIMYGVSIFYDLISFIWRWVCLSYEGALTCPSLSPGRSFARIQWADAGIFVTVDIVCVICLILYIRAAMTKYHLLLRAQEKRGGLQNNVVVVSRQSWSLLYARRSVRSLISFDLFAWVIVAILRFFFFNGLGFWWVIYLGVPHLVVFLFALEVSGSEEAKTRPEAGGTNASQSPTFVSFVLYTMIGVMVLDVVALVLSTYDLATLFVSMTLLEEVMGFLIWFGESFLLLYSIYLMISLWRLSSAMDEDYNNKKFL